MYSLSESTRNLPTSSDNHTGDQQVPQDVPSLQDERDAVRELRSPNHVRSRQATGSPSPRRQQSKGFTTAGLKSNKKPPKQNSAGKTSSALPSNVSDELTLPQRHSASLSPPVRKVLSGGGEGTSAALDAEPAPALPNCPSWSLAPPVRNVLSANEDEIGKHDKAPSPTAVIGERDIPLPPPVLRASTAPSSTVAQSPSRTIKRHKRQTSEEVNTRLFNSLRPPARRDLSPRRDDYPAAITSTATAGFQPKRTMEELEFPLPMDPSPALPLRKKPPPRTKNNSQDADSPKGVSLRPPVRTKLSPQQVHATAGTVQPKRTIEDLEFPLPMDPSPPPPVPKGKQQKTAPGTSHNRRPVHSKIHPKSISAAQPKRKSSNEEMEGIHDDPNAVRHLESVSSAYSEQSLPLSAAVRVDSNQTSTANSGSSAAIGDQSIGSSQAVFTPSNDSWTGKDDPPSSFENDRKRIQIPPGGRPPLALVGSLTNGSGSQTIMDRISELSSTGPEVRHWESIDSTYSEQSIPLSAAVRKDSANTGEGSSSAINNLSMGSSQAVVGVNEESWTGKDNEHSAHSKPSPPESIVTLIMSPVVSSPGRPLPGVNDEEQHNPNTVALQPRLSKPDDVEPAREATHSAEVPQTTSGLEMETNESKQRRFSGGNVRRINANLLPPSLVLQETTVMEPKLSIEDPFPGETSQILSEQSVADPIVRKIRQSRLPPSLVFQQFAVPEPELSIDDSLPTPKQQQQTLSPIERIKLPPSLVLQANTALEPMLSFSDDDVKKQAAHVSPQSWDTPPSPVKSIDMAGAIDLNSSGEDAKMPSSHADDGDTSVPLFARQVTALGNKQSLPPSLVMNRQDVASLPAPSLALASPPRARKNPPESNTSNGRGGSAYAQQHGKGGTFRQIQRALKPPPQQETAAPMEGTVEPRESEGIGSVDARVVRGADPQHGRKGGNFRQVRREINRSQNKNQNANTNSSSQKEREALTAQGSNSPASSPRKETRAQKRARKEQQQFLDQGDNVALDVSNAPREKADRRARRRAKEADQGNSGAVVPTSHSSQAAATIVSDHSVLSAPDLVFQVSDGTTVYDDPEAHARYGLDKGGLSDRGDIQPRNFRARQRVAGSISEEEYNDDSEDEDLVPGAFNVTTSGIVSRHKGQLTASQRFSEGNNSGRPSGNAATVRSMLSAYSAKTQESAKTRESAQETSRPSPEPDGQPRKDPNIGRKRVVKLAVVVLLVIAVGVAVPLALLGGSSPAPNPTTSPTLAPTIASTTAASFSLKTMDMIDFLTNTFGFTKSDLEDPTRPQSQAVMWLAESDGLSPSNDPDEVILERYLVALLVFSLDRREFFEGLGFLSRASLCGWGDSGTGVFCNEDGRVNRITLTTRLLTGSIPTEICSLPALSALQLANNELTGSIPSEIGLCSNLVELNLQRNSFEGLIPSEIGLCTNLVNIELEINKLTGTIPESLENLDMLEVLSLTSTDISGSIPSSLFSISTLKRLELQGTKIMGTIPNELSRLTSLETFNIVGTGHASVIPTEIGTLTSLTFLGLGDTRLTGTIPSEIGMLLNLSVLRLDETDLEATIPTEIGQLTLLNELRLERAIFLDGPIPTEFSELTSLNRLRLGDTGLVDDSSIVESLCATNNVTDFSVCDTEIPCSCCNGAC